MAVYELHKPANEFLSFEIAKLIQQDATDMIVAVRVTTGTAKRAFLRYFNRKERCAAGENRFPAAQNLRRLHE